jgi:hypothetical protein
MGSAELDLPLTGIKEIVAVADTGIDTGDANTVHEDFRGRIVGIKSWPITPAFDSYIKNPGTTVVRQRSRHSRCRSVLGDGKEISGSRGINSGLAYNAGLFFQAIDRS